MKNSVYWFGHDLRLEDNECLRQACLQSDAMLCVYVIDPQLFRPSRLTDSRMSSARWRFLYESLAELNRQLNEHDQHLMVLYRQPENAIAELITKYDIHSVYRSSQVGSDEVEMWQQLKGRYRFIKFVEHQTHTVFQEEALPFSLDDLPKTFSQFNAAVKDIAPSMTASSIEHMPPSLAHQHEFPTSLPAIQTNSLVLFSGGEQAAHRHLHRYFASTSPSSYKETRNALDGFEQSTKFSPWLALGCLSAKQVLVELSAYEQKNGANDSTYWILFELLWREYFQWYALKHGKRVFRFSGIKDVKPLTSYYPERLKLWTEACTPFPIVNACINQLKLTGYLSNRGRQIVASCLVNELRVDWRFGAAFFEQHLLDYDVAVNWGNWQYLAGVGCDPRGLRHFCLDKQTSTFDPDGEYIKRWRGETGLTSIHAVDSVDASDWPIQSAKL